MRAPGPSSSSSSASLAPLALSVQLLLAAAATSAALSFLRYSGNDNATPFLCRRLSAPRHPFFFFLAAAVEPSSVVATVKGWTTDEPVGVPSLGACFKAPPSNEGTSTKAAAAVHSVVSDLAFHLFMTDLGYT